MTQLLLKAAISGLLVALASEAARRSAGLGGLIASLPLVSLLTMVWLWRDTGDAGRIADLAVSSTVYVIASLPAFIVLAALLRRGVAIPLGLAVFVVVGFVGYSLAAAFGRKAGLPL